MINPIVQMGKQGLREEKELVHTRAEIQTQAGWCQSDMLNHDYAGSYDHHVMLKVASVCFSLSASCLAVCLSVKVIRNSNDIVPLLKYRRKGQKGRAELLSKKLPRVCTLGEELWPGRIAKWHLLVTSCGLQGRRITATMTVTSSKKPEGSEGKAYWLEAPKWRFPDRLFPVFHTTKSQESIFFDTECLTTEGPTCLISYPIQESASKRLIDISPRSSLLL